MQIARPKVGGAALLKMALLFCLKSAVDQSVSKKFSDVPSITYTSVGFISTRSG